MKDAKEFWICINRCSRIYGTEVAGVLTYMTNAKELGFVKKKTKPNRIDASKILRNAFVGGLAHESSRNSSA